jgi:cold shock CspA family protein
MDRGYGFIKTEDEKDLFFHRNDIEEMDFDTLREGQQVEFEVGRGQDGRQKAVRVRVAEPKGE